MNEFVAICLYFSDANGIGLYCPPRTLVNGSLTIKDPREEFDIISILTLDDQINYTYHGVNHTFKLSVTPHYLTDLDEENTPTQVTVHIKAPPENAHCTFTVGK